MMIKSLLVTFGILGSSSVALADHFHAPRSDHPVRYFDDRERDDGFRRDDDFRRNDDFRRHTTWVPLTSPMRQYGPRTEIDVSMRDRFGQVRLQNKTGRTHVRAIMIQFRNGEQQVIRVDRLLFGHRERVDIDLSGEARRIDRIVVVGRTGQDGSYQLYAM